MLIDQNYIQGVVDKIFAHLSQSERHRWLETPIQ
jgi:hypothetical protein